MTTGAQIDGSLPDLGDTSTVGLVFAGGWAVQFDWVANRATAGGQPQRLSALPFPPGFDQTIEGALRGRQAFSPYVYVFSDGQYVRLNQAGLGVDSPAADTQSNWGLPPGWTSYSAVLPGRSTKIGFCYFINGPQYVRFDWTANQVSPGYPRFISAEWHTNPPFEDQFDGVIAGQGAFASKGYVFTTLEYFVDRDGSPVAEGSAGAFTVAAPGYLRYDFDAATAQGTVTDPFDVVTQWPGLFPLLDAGPAVDTALTWVGAAQAALTTPNAPAVQTALGHHFGTATPSPDQLQTITNNFAAVNNRLLAIPDRFQWSPGLSFPAQTRAQQLTEVGDQFSHNFGPNGRAAVMIHEAVHFIFPDAASVLDIPEWSGATINGVTHEVAGGIAYANLTTGQALTNPSSYAAFAQEVFFGDDTRYGDARRQE